MKRREVLCFLWTAVLLGISDLVAAEAEAAIPPGADPAHFQGRVPLDARPRLSASQQAQILSDVQQHQTRYRRPQQEQQRVAPFANYEQQNSKAQGNAAFSSLAKYKVDRTKQQQIQQLLQQQQQVQQLINQQQQKIAQQLGPNFLNSAQLQFQGTSPKQQQFQQPQQQPQQQQQYNQFQTPATYRNLQQDLSQPLFSDQQTVQLQEYFEKQRELELLQKQRQQLLLEQQELRRQQELLRIQQLKQLTSTTLPPPPPSPPSTTPPATLPPSTTTSPILVSLPTARKITPSEAELFLKAIASHQKKFSTTTSRPTTKPVTKSTTQEKVPATSIPENILTLLQDQDGQILQKGKSKPEIKIIYQTEKPTTQKSATTRARSSSNTLSERDLLLKQLKLALAQSVDDDPRNVSARDIVLPDGKKVQVINAPSDLSSIVGAGSSTALQSSTTVIIPTTTIRPPKAIFDELTKGVLPPGADFEIIRQKSDGKLEEIGKAPIQNLPAKKVTFVVLEEQPDGSYKVQGVKGNTDKEAPDVESIVDRIKKGELKLPPSSLNPTTSTPLSTLQDISSSSVDPTVTPTRSSSSTSSFATTQSSTFKTTTPRSTSSSRYTESGRGSSEYFPFVTISPNSVSTTDKYVTSASSVTGHVFNSLGSLSTTARPTTVNQETRITTRYPAVTRNHFIPTMAPVSEIVTSTPTPRPTTFSHHSTDSYSVFSAKQSETPSVTRLPSTTAKSVNNIQNDNVVYEDNFDRTTPIPSPVESTSAKSEESLTTLLRREGLFAMAKYLTLSGLDIVLNETGPYTIFVPTDKAFRTLMVQLGGPEKAELKFRDSPRLLGGLLLHHVIPGAFRIDTLQDEMTGVSLAGTQLRVNEYAMHDHEWNDVKVTTINGARVAPNKRDIEIPQGVIHAIDRVMFPLPVGDLVQTLQADRESRFTTFLRMLHVSGLEETLSAGPKTFTVFAPTDSAFEAATSKDGGPIWSEGDGADAAKVIISRHIIPGTLYTAGMRYYLQKDTLRQVPIHIHKNGGRVKVNEAHMITHNVPATNGVLHAIDGVL